VTARNQVEIYPEISAVVTEVLVQNGNAVTRGQPLVRLRDTEFNERLKQAKASHQIASAELRRAEAQVREARSERDRFRSLADRDLASGAELESVEARAESAEADVELAHARVAQALATADEMEQNLSRTVIRSPIDGHVGNRGAEVGLLATPSARLFTVGQLDSVQVEIVLSDRMLAYIKEGQRTEITTRGETLTGPLARISPFLHPVSHSTEAQIDLANPNRLLNPGMFVTVDVFFGESERATLVPLSAIYEQSATGATGVYVATSAIDPGSAESVDTREGAALVGPVSFEFARTEVIARGRMEAAVTNVPVDAWVVTLGQNLLGAETTDAMVRPVRPERVERLQRLQREDLMQEVIEGQASR
jgi:RND family efflux transporter MFP subunit